MILIFCRTISDRIKHCANGNIDICVNDNIIACQTSQLTSEGGVEPQSLLDFTSKII